MKSYLIIWLFLTLAISTQGQSGYNLLPMPQTDFLGKPLVNLDLKKGIVAPNVAAPQINFIYEIVSGPTESNEYAQHVETLILPIVRKNKYRVVKVDVDSIKIISLAPENFYNGNISPGVFAYDGLIADTVRITYRTSRDLNIDLSQLIDSLGKYIPGVVWKDVSNVVKNVKINGKDSIDRQIAIVNPNVIYAARFVEYTESQPLIGGSFEVKYKHFARGEKANLTIEGSPGKARSGKVSPEWRKGKKDLQHTYFLKAFGSPNNLKLGLFKDEKNNKNFPGGRLIVEIPYVLNNDGARKYKMEYSTVDSYIDSNGFLRLFRVEVYAQQTNPTTIQIHNFDNKDLLTYAKYPYFDFKYVIKM